MLVRTGLFFRGGDRCRCTEVKAGTSVKAHEIQDAAVQAWVLRGAGVAVEEVRLCHVDSTFVYPGDDDYAGLLHENDVTAAVDELVPAVAGQVRALRAMQVPGLPLPGPHATLFRRGIECAARQRHPARAIVILPSGSPAP